jgi:hypothetical protein
MKDDRRQGWSRDGLGGRRRCPASISKALPYDAFDRAIGASDVIDTEPDPVRIAEIKFGQIPMQVSLAHVLIDAVDPALHDREVAFDGVGIVVIPDIFLRRVAHDAMVGVESARDAIDGDSSLWNRLSVWACLAMIGRQVGGGHIRNVEATNAAVALNESEYRLFERRVV